MFWVISSCPSDHADEDEAKSGDTTLYSEEVKLGKVLVPFQSYGGPRQLRKTLRSHPVMPGM
jgi:hypothetical protein